MIWFTNIGFLRVQRVCGRGKIYQPYLLLIEDVNFQWEYFKIEYLRPRVFQNSNNLT